jgi:hypothetical protein
MWLRCDKTGDLPVSAWEQRKPFSEFTTQDSKVHEVGHREPCLNRGPSEQRASLRAQRSTAYHHLSSYARSLLFELIDLRRGRPHKSA